jgi:uncharacterized protein with PIN domain/molybdopterin converting factor small subunit
MACAAFRFYGELNAFLPPERRQREFVARLARAATAKHMIEALGVPHTEVAWVLVNEAPSGLSQRLHDGDRVAVFPNFQRLPLPAPPLNAPPPGRPRFIADCHLGGLARLLRMAGFDTRFRNDYDDREIAHLAAQEGRIVLTRDRELLKLREIRHGAFIHAIKAAEQFAETVRRFALLPHFAPFSRCLICNEVLQPVSKETVADELPPAVRRHQQTFRRCPRCQRLYWPGSHWQRMQQMLHAVTDGYVVGRP